MLTPGTLLQNRYEIMRLIGRGGMGAVYQAKDHRLGHRVALKQMLVEDKQLRQAFRREARILASLHHPVLPGVSDHFAEGDGQFLVMRYIPGDDLATLLEKQGALPVKRVLAWADQLLEALEYLHGQQPPIIHRDIKPPNLKVTGRGNIVLLDFGLAKGGNLGQTTRITTTGGQSIFGYTPHYAPLEQIQGTGTDPRSDIYALAATLYHLLTGTQPPDALVRATNVLNNRPDPLQPPHLINRQIPLALSTLLMQSMSQNANERPSSAALMRQMLQKPPQTGTSSAQTRTVAPPPPTVPSRGIGSSEVPTRIRQSAAPASFTPPPYQSVTQRPIRQPSTTTRAAKKRNPLVLVLAGIAALLLVFVIGMGGWWLANNASPPSDETPKVVIVEESPTPTETISPTETVEQPSLDVTQESVPEEASQPTQSPTPTIEGVTPTTESTIPTEEANTPTEEPNTPTQSASPEPELPTHTPTVFVPTNTSPPPPTNTPTVFVPTNTSPPSPTNTPTVFVPTNTSPPSPTNTSPPSPTNTPPPSPTNTPTVFVPTNTPTPSPTNTPTLFVPTNTPTLFVPTNTPTPPPTNTPTPSPTNTPPPTNTPTPSPTNTPTPPPTNTPTPSPTITNTPIPPPTITNTPLPAACDVPAGSTFASVWQNNRDIMGCALDNQITIPTMAEQLFEGGQMFWRSDTDEIYAIYDRSGGGTLTQGSWQRDSSWVWDGSDPDGVGKTPPPGYQEPLRGFGWVWRTFLNAENGPLGWARDREYGFNNIGQVQRFENGLMFKGSDPAIYLLLYNGSFYRQ